MVSREAKRFIGNVMLATVLTGCQIFSPDQKVVPTATPEAIPTMIPTLTPLPSRGARYDEFRARLDDPDLEVRYERMFGRGLFETREDYLASDKPNIYSIGFTWGDGRYSYMAYGGGFLEKDIMFEDRLSLRTDSPFCAPGSEGKRNIYNALASAFEPGEKADKRLIQAVMAGATPDCSYFVDVETKTAPNSPQDVRIKG